MCCYRIVTGAVVHVMQKKDGVMHDYCRRMRKVVSCGVTECNTDSEMASPPAPTLSLLVLLLTMYHRRCKCSQINLHSVQTFPPNSSLCFPVFSREVLGVVFTRAQLRLMTLSHIREGQICFRAAGRVRKAGKS